MARRIVVVGSGIVGASIALHLAREGASVRVLDRDSVGGLATRHSFAWINASWGNPRFYFDFPRHAMAAWIALDESVPGLGLKRCGSLLWDLPPQALEAYCQEHASWGYGIRKVGRDEALAIEPGLATPPELAVHVAEEAMVEPVFAAQAMLGAAGISVEAIGVTGLVTRNGRVVGVVTDKGHLPADQVVIAAGTASPQLLATAGVALSMTTPPGLIAHSTPVPERLLKGMVMAPDVHVRQTAEGRLIAGSDFAGGDPGSDPQAMAQALVDKTRALVHGADGIELDFFTIGHRPTPADGFPLIGRPGDIDGLYLAAMHSGVTLAPLVGALAAKEIVHNERDILLAPFHPDRTPIVAEI